MTNANAVMNNILGRDRSFVKNFDIRLETETGDRVRVVTRYAELAAAAEKRGQKKWQRRKLLLISFTFVTVLAFVLLRNESSYVDSLTRSEYAKQRLILQHLTETTKIIFLEKSNIYEDMITLSGFSSGASMATQFHMSHSSLFRGIAMFSQAFYRCGPKSLTEFGLRCSSYGHGWIPYKVSSAISDARNYEATGEIDPLESLRDQRVFIWTGWTDEYVPQVMARLNKEFYSAFVSNPRQISLTVNPIAMHLLPTKNYGDACDQDAGKNVYLGNCNYTGAFHALRFLLGKSVVTENDGTYNPDSLMLYNQTEFYPGKDIKEVAMGTVGWIYYPRKCQEGRVKCYLHINFHGCNEYPPDVAKIYIENNEFLPIAEANNIILIFPLTTKVPQNMDGCWDFYSYTGPDFATKSGKQIQVAHRILQRLLRGPRNPKTVNTSDAGDSNFVKDENLIV